MQEEMQADEFLSSYPGQVASLAHKLRKVVLENLPAVTEQVDAAAKMLAYGYGQKYADLVCVLIPSKKGMKLGFNRGVDLPDPNHLLQGTGKISRYVEIKSAEQISSEALKTLLKEAWIAYRHRVAKTKSN